MKKAFSEKQHILGTAVRRSALGMAVVAALSLPLAAARACGFHKPAMFLDAQHQFSDSQALAATAASTNIIDLGTDRNVGIGEPMCVVINVEVAADAVTGDESYTFDLETDDNAGFASPLRLARRVVAALPDIPRATAAAGFKFIIPVPSDTTPERFLRMNYTLAGTTPSITVSAHLMPMSMCEVGSVVYPKGYTIS